MLHAPSLLFPSHLSTTSLSTCTPVRPSIRKLLLSTSHGDLPCADPSNVSFGLLAGPYSPTGCEPNSHSEISATITDIPTSGPVVRNHYSSKMADGFKKTARRTTYRSLSSSSSLATPTFPTSVPQEVVIPTLHPASTRIESTPSKVWVHPSHEPAGTKKTTKMETTRPYGDTRCVICQNG